MDQTLDPIAELQLNVADLARALEIQLNQLERWARLLPEPTYTPDDDAPDNLAAQLQSHWQAQAEELRHITRQLLASSRRTDR